MAGESMRLGDILRLSRQNLFRRKSRTILTVLGVIVGCCSIVIMMSLGAGINEQNDAMLKQMGDLTVITVYPSDGSSSGGGMYGGTAQDTQGQAKLDDDAVENFKTIENVQGATAHLMFQGYNLVTAGTGNRYKATYLSVEAIDMTQLDNMGYKITDGRAPLKDGEVLIGQDTAYNFQDTLRPEAEAYRMPPMPEGSCMYDETGQCVPMETEDPFFDPLKTPLQLTLSENEPAGGDSGVGTVAGTSDASATGSSATAKPTQLQPVGVLKQDYNKGTATSNGILMDITQLRDLVSKTMPQVPKNFLQYDSILVKTNDISTVSAVESQIRSMGYNTQSSEQIREELQKQSQGIQLILGGIGAVSLLVAAIGIANTMIMSVSERTREIGIMKALGCYVRDIRVMFLTEAGSIGLLGGVIGCLISAAVSMLINLIGLGGFTGENFWKAIVGGEDVSRSSVIPWWLYVFAIVFAVCIGLISGFQPANKAVRIPALDAIKNEQ